MTIDSDDRQAAHLLVRGIVQGVGYRYWTERVARSLGLGGWVRNLHDGRVEIYAEGPKASLRALVERCHDGPSSASVTDVDRADRAPRGRLNFEIRPTAEVPGED